MKTLQMTYGSHDTPCTVFSYNGWYVIEGSSRVNFTTEELTEGESVEYIQDTDCFTFNDGIHSMDELTHHVDEYEEYLKEAHG